MEGVRGLADLNDPLKNDATFLEAGAVTIIFLNRVNVVI